MPIRKFLSIGETLFVFTIELYKWSEKVLKGNFESYIPLSLDEGILDKDFTPEGYASFMGELASFNRQGFLDSKYCFMTPRFLFEVLRSVKAKYAIGEGEFLIIQEKISELSDVYLTLKRMVLPGKASHFYLTLGIRWDDYDSVDNKGCIAAFACIKRYGVPCYADGLVPGYTNDLVNYITGLYKGLDYLYDELDVLLSVAVVYCAALVYIEGQGSTENSAWLVSLEEFIYDSTYSYSCLIDTRVLYQCFQDFCIRYEFDYKDLSKVPLVLFYNYIIEYLKRKLNISEDVFDFVVLRKACEKLWPESYKRVSDESIKNTRVIKYDVISNETILGYSYDDLSYYAYNFRCGLSDSFEKTIQNKKGTLGYLELLGMLKEITENQPEHVFKGSYTGLDIGGLLGAFLCITCNYEVSVPIRSRFFKDCYRLSVEDNLGGVLCSIEYINRIIELLR